MNHERISFNTEPLLENDIQNNNIKLLMWLKANIIELFKISLLISFLGIVINLNVEINSINNRQNKLDNQLDTLTTLLSAVNTLQLSSTIQNNQIFQYRDLIESTIRISCFRNISSCSITIDTSQFVWPIVILRSGMYWFLFDCPSQSVSAGLILINDLSFSFKCVDGSGVSWCFFREMLFVNDVIKITNKGCSMLLITSSTSIN